MRRIVWVDGEIGKAIIIGQNFENTTFDSPHWDFLIVAWLEVSKLNTSARPMWKKHLLNKVSLDSIVTRIDQLLLESLRNLSAIKKDDLRYD